VAAKPGPQHRPTFTPDIRKIRTIIGCITPYVAALSPKRLGMTGNHQMIQGFNKSMANSGSRGLLVRNRGQKDKHQRQ